VKCNRCKKEVPVLTPLPEGDQDVCEQCYAEVYQASTAKRPMPKGALVGAVVCAAAALVVAAYVVLLRGGAPATPPPQPSDAAAVSITGPNKPPPKTVKPKQPKAKPKAAPPKAETPKPKEAEPAPTAPQEPAPAPEAAPTPPAEEAQPEGEKTEPAEKAGSTETKAEEAPQEPKPAAESTQPKVIETNEFSLTFRSAKRLGKATVSFPAADGATSTADLNGEGVTFFELAFTLAPKAENDLVIGNASLAVGGTVLTPIQGKVFDLPYTAPSAEVLEFSPQARMALSFGAEENSAQAVESGAAIGELAVARKDRATQIPVTLLFAVPAEHDPAAVFVLDNQEFAVTLPAQ
jgi:hypothetical protein